MDFLQQLWSVVVDFFLKPDNYLSTSIIIYVVLAEALLILILFLIIIIGSAKRGHKEKKAKAAKEEGKSDLSKRAYKKKMKELERQAEYEAVKQQFAKENPNATPKQNPTKSVALDAPNLAEEAPKKEEPVKQEAKAPVDTSELDEKIEKEQELIALLEQEKALLLELEELREKEREAKEEKRLEEVQQKAEDNFEKFLVETGMAKKKEVVEEEPAEEIIEEEIVEDAPPATPVEEPIEEEDLDEDEAEEEEEEEELEEELVEDETLVEEPVEEAKEASIEINEYVACDPDGTPKKIKRKFNIKMMFTPYDTKRYYNEVKNYLLLYRAKSRISSRCETFRNKGLVAKVALGGKSLKVYLALDPSIIEQYPKYHLKNFGDKKQYADVPVMIKVRSERSLKYFKELVDLLFEAKLIKPNKKYEEQNFLPSLIPNGEAILANLGMETYYLQNSMNVHGIPEEMPDDLVEYIPQIPGEDLEGPEEEAVAYLDTLCNHFNDGDEVTLDVLKSMHICQKGNVLRIKARGTLDRQLIIYAEKYDNDAIKMLMCTNCTAVRIVRYTEEEE